MWHIITTQYPPLLLNGLRFQLRFRRTICCLRLVVFQTQHFAGVLQLAFCCRYITVQLASIRRNDRFQRSLPLRAGNAIAKYFSSRFNIIGAAVDAPGDAPVSAAMVPCWSLTTSVPRRSTPPLSASRLIICTRCPACHKRQSSFSPADSTLSTLQNDPLHSTSPDSPDISPDRNYPAQRASSASR